MGFGLGKCCPQPDPLCRPSDSLIAPEAAHQYTCALRLRITVSEGSTGPRLEDMLVEILLQALVGEVDAQLLEAVLLERLEPVDVQDPNRALSLCSPACGAKTASMPACCEAHASTLLRPSDTADGNLALATC